jgi:hypothetical protein
MPDSKTDWPIDRRYQHNFDFDYDRSAVYEETVLFIGVEIFNRE